MKVLVLGAGKMTGAILHGFKSSENMSEWEIFSPTGASAQKLALEVGGKFIRTLSEASEPDWILIGCKPQQLKDLKTTLNGRWQNTLFISMLAALSEEQQRSILGVKYLMRIMPNLPVEHRVGVTLLSSDSAKARLPSFEALFQKLGTAMTVKEEELDELTLLTGSGPAFFYEFTKLLAQNFTSLDEEKRETLARAVLLGSAKASKLSKRPLDEMINAVTSKGGVTIAVLEGMRKEGLVSVIQKGIALGKKRTEELKELLRS